MAVDVYLIRHGQTCNNVTGERMYNAGLTDLGRSQAECVAASLARAGLTTLLCSPLLRAMETGAYVAGATGLPQDVCNDLVEFNRWDPYVGASRACLAARFPRARLEAGMPALGWRYAGPEPPAAGRSRIRRVLSMVAALPGGSVVAIVAHGTYNGQLLGAWLGIRGSGGVAFAQDNACINHLTLVSGHVVVHRLNDTRHLVGIAASPA